MMILKEQWICSVQNTYIIDRPEKKKILIGIGIVSALLLGVVIYSRIKKSRSRAELISPPPEQEDVEISESSTTQPDSMPKGLNVLAFQVFANKFLLKPILIEDRIWAKNSACFWNIHGTDYKGAKVSRRCAKHTVCDQPSHDKIIWRGQAYIRAVHLIPPYYPKDCIIQ